MMPDRIAAIEAAIARRVAAGLPITNDDVYREVGGSRTPFTAYM